jgi:hypothetical protein
MYLVSFNNDTLKQKIVYEGADQVLRDSWFSIFYKIIKEHK